MKHRLVTNNALRGLLYREAVRRRATVLPYAPLAVYLDPCNACNLRCTFCPQSNWGRRERGMMAWDLFERAVAEIAELRPQRLFLFCFGESTLHRDIGRMVRRAVEAGLFVRLHTNAVALGEPMARELVEGGLDECCFSFDTADREQYNHMRAGSDFDRVLANIRRAVEVRDGLGLAKPKFILQEIVPYEAGRRAENSAAYRKLFDGCRVVFKAKHMHSFAGQGIEEEFAVVRSEGTSHCSQLYRRIVVTFDGKIHACCLDPEGHNIVGDLTRGDTIAGAWNSPRMAELRRRTNEGDVADLPPCDKCDILARAPRVSRRLPGRLVSSLVWRMVGGQRATPASST